MALLIVTSRQVGKVWICCEAIVEPMLAFARPVISHAHGRVFRRLDSQR